VTSSNGPAGPPSTWHTQDWLVCIEALATITHPENRTPRETRAWQLLESIATGCKIDPGEYIFKIDDDWGPQTAVRAVENSPQPSTDSFADEDWQLLETALSELGEAASNPDRIRRATQLATSISEYTRIDTG
jgi:hypothetical protein